MSGEERVAYGLNTQSEREITSSTAINWVLSPFERKVKKFQLFRVARPLASAFAIQLIGFHCFRLYY